MAGGEVDVDRAAEDHTERERARRLRSEARRPVEQEPADTAGNQEAQAKHRPRREPIAQETAADRDQHAQAIDAHYLAGVGRREVELLAQISRIHAEEAEDREPGDDAHQHEQVGVAVVQRGGPAVHRRAARLRRDRHFAHRRPHEDRDQQHENEPDDAEADHRRAPVAVGSQHAGAEQGTDDRTDAIGTVQRADPDGAVARKEARDDGEQRGELHGLADAGERAIGQHVGEAHRDDGDDGRHREDEHADLRHRPACIARHQVAGGKSRERHADSEDRRHQARFWQREAELAAHLRQDQRKQRAIHRVDRIGSEQHGDADGGKDGGALRGATRAGAEPQIGLCHDLLRDWRRRTSRGSARRSRTARPTCCGCAAVPRGNSADGGARP